MFRQAQHDIFDIFFPCPTRKFLIFRDALMIVNYIDVGGLLLNPMEYNPPLVIYTDAPKPFEIAWKFFQAIAGRNPQTEMARHLKWPYARLNEIINGRRGISADSALSLGEALGAF